jgi:hypothetical protein
MANQSTGIIDLLGFFKLLNNYHPDMTAHVYVV